MIALALEHGEIGQLRQSDIHPESRAFARPIGHVALGFVGYRALGDEAVEQQPWINPSYGILGAPRLAAGDDTGRASALDNHFLDRRVE